MRALNQSDVKDRIVSSGAEAVSNTPERFAAAIIADVVNAAKLIKDAGIKADQFYTEIPDNS